MPSFIPKGKRINVSMLANSFNRQSRRHTLRFGFDLSAGDSTLVGLPEWLQTAYTNIVRTGNLTRMQQFDIVLTAMTVECFSTEKARRPDWAVMFKANLSKFAMTRTGESDEDAAVKLQFIAEFDALKECHDWIFESKKANFWLAFEASQQALNLSGEQTDAAGSDDDESDDEEDASQENLPLDDEDDDSDEDESDDDDEDDEDEDEPAELEASESQSAKAARIRKEAEANAANAAPAARPALIGNVPKRTPSVFNVQ